MIEYAHGMPHKQPNTVYACALVSAFGSSFSLLNFIFDFKTCCVHISVVRAGIINETESWPQKHIEHSCLFNENERIALIVRRIQPRWWRF